MRHLWYYPWPKFNVIWHDGPFLVSLTLTYPFLRLADALMRFSELPDHNLAQIRAGKARNTRVIVLPVTEIQRYLTRWTYFGVLDAWLPIFEVGRCIGEVFRAIRSQFSPKPSRKGSKYARNHTTGDWNSTLFDPMDLFRCPWRMLTHFWGWPMDWWGFQSCQTTI